ncbi:MAG: uncharacterized protein QOF51_2858 [Chloroflexota bacterium]|jgi:predicted TIM-barrel fold metal-dependent hydrolase|nr:uncharacterized protein [Chloroflexota bacterium]
MDGVIDADTHVIESDAIWRYFDEAFAHRRPVAFAHDDPSTGERRSRWLIDGAVYPKPDGKGGQNLITPPLDSEEWTTPYWGAKFLTDVGARLADADKMGVDVQVVYPTLFIMHLTWDPELEVALCRAYNRFMGDVWRRGHGRLRWVAVLPFLNIAASCDELDWSREHGAVGFMAKGMEGDRSLAEPWFFPVYEAASRLDMPMCIHTGGGAPAISSIMDNRIAGAFCGVRLLPLMAFQNLVGNRIPERFPDLRIGFIETGASWVPYALHFIERDWRRRRQLDTAHFGPELFHDYRVFVACESDEDIPYLTGYIGEDNLLTGSDYGHHFGQLPTIEPNSFQNRQLGGDASADLSIVGTMRAREDMTSDALQKLLVDNPRRFYGL